MGIGFHDECVIYSVANCRELQEALSRIVVTSREQVRGTFPGATHRQPPPRSCPEYLLIESARQQLPQEGDHFSSPRAPDGQLVSELLPRLLMELRDQVLHLPSTDPAGTLFVSWPHSTLGPKGEVTAATVSLIRISRLPVTVQVKIGP